MIPRTTKEAWQHIRECRYAKHGDGRSCVTHDVYPAELPSRETATLPDIFDHVIIAVERNDRALLQEQFMLMLLQDRLVRSAQHEHLIVHGTMREDGINWPIEHCTACDWWR